MGGRPLKELVIIALVPPPAATKIPNSADQHILFHNWLFTLTVVQVIAFELTIAILPLQTATNNPNSGDQHMPYHCWLLTVIDVQLIPSGLVINILP